MTAPNGRQDPAAGRIGRGAQLEQVRNTAAQQRAEDAEHDRGQNAYQVLTRMQQPGEESGNETQDGPADQGGIHLWNSTNWLMFQD
jgi:hypothetical protein